MSLARSQGFRKIILFIALSFVIYLSGSFNDKVFALCRDDICYLPPHECVPIGCPNYGHYTACNYSTCKQWKTCYMVGNSCVMDCDIIGACVWDWCDTCDDGGGGDDNHRPTASITVPVGCPGTDVNPVVLPNKAGQANTITVNASDIDSNLERIDLYFRPWDRPSSTYTDPFTSIGQQACSGDSCSATFSWNTNRSGWSVIYPNVSDALGEWCTGLPYHTYDCDPSRPETDDIDNCKVYANTPPSWEPIAGQNISGPSQVRVNHVVMLSPNVYDPDYSADPPHSNSHQVRTSWTDTCTGTFPNISEIRIRAKGDQVNGIGPDMQVYRAPLSGSAPYPARTPITGCSFGVGNTTYPSDPNAYNYSCNVNSQNSVLDIAFLNDLYADGKDRNLYIDWVELVHSVSGYGYEVTRIQAEGLVESPVGSPDPAYAARVVYDRGIPSNSAFDGADINPSPFNLGDQVILPWNGALRLGPLWRAPANVATCNVSVGVSDRYHTGETKSKSINVCGLGPAAPSIPCTTTPKYQYSESLTVPLTWNSVTNWGNTCNLIERSYRVQVKRADESSFTQVNQIPHSSLNPPTHTWSYIPPFNVPGVYEWRVVSDNKEYVSAPSNSCFFEIEQSPLPGWFTSIEGDVYAPGITMTLPQNPDPIWSGSKLRLARGKASNLFGTVFSGGPGGRIEMYLGSGTEVNNSLISESTKWAKYMPVSNLWPSQFMVGGVPQFTLPSTAEHVSHVNNLSPNKVYYTTHTNFFNGSKYFDLTGPGVAVLYYTGDQDLLINQYVRHKSDDSSERLLLILNKNLEVRYTVNVNDPPTPTTQAAVEMGILSSGNITFTRRNPEGADSSVVVEGPLVAAGSLSFLRNRGGAGINNKYPAEIVRYNPNVLYQLTVQERASSVPNYTGLFKYLIIWESGK
jgi:hypothetical protein